jgi:hypothetical protein
MSVLGHSTNVLKSLPGGHRNNSHPLVTTELQRTIMPSTQSTSKVQVTVLSIFWSCLGVCDSGWGFWACPVAARWGLWCGYPSNWHLWVIFSPFLNWVLCKDSDKLGIQSQNQWSWNGSITPVVLKCAMFGSSMLNHAPDICVEVPGCLCQLIVFHGKA